MTPERGGMETGKGLRSRNGAGRAALLLAGLFLFFLAAAGGAGGQGLMILARKVAGPLPLDPADPLWETVPPLEVPLSAQVMAKPRVYETSVGKLSVRAAHNGHEVAFRVAWPDETEDALLDLDRFCDAVALEFPSSSAPGKPHFAMGDGENTVNIWYWQAAAQGKETKSPPEEKREYQPRFYTGDNLLFYDDFRPGLLAGNPLSRAPASPVENLIARGFESATHLEKAQNQNIRGSGSRQPKGWAVVFTRALLSESPHEVVFREGEVTPVAFALWDGSRGHRGGRKEVSTWYSLGLETEEKKTTYIFPVVALLAALGLEAGIIRRIRKKREREGR